jgi:hypothetical protein
MPIAVAIYLPEQYSRLLATAEDASDLETTWQEWHQNLLETKQQMAALGMHLIDIVIDLDALEKYCQERGLKNTSSTRSQYAAHLLSEGQKSQNSLHQQFPAKLQLRKKKRKKR